MASFSNAKVKSACVLISVQEHIMLDSGRAEIPLKYLHVEIEDMPIYVASILCPLMVECVHHNIVTRKIEKFRVMLGEFPVNLIDCSA
jgi:hypothetical protein